MLWVSLHHRFWLRDLSRQQCCWPHPWCCAYSCFGLSLTSGRSSHWMHPAPWGAEMSKFIRTRDGHKLEVKRAISSRDLETPPKGFWQSMPCEQHWSFVVLRLWNAQWWGEAWASKSEQEPCHKVFLCLSCTWGMVLIQILQKALPKLTHLQLPEKAKRWYGLLSCFSVQITSLHTQCCRLMYVTCFSFSSLLVLTWHKKTLAASDQSSLGRTQFSASACTNTGCAPRCKTGVGRQFSERVLAPFLAGCSVLWMGCSCVSMRF